MFSSSRRLQHAGLLCSLAGVLIVSSLSQITAAQSWDAKVEVDTLLAKLTSLKQYSQILVLMNRADGVKINFVTYLKAVVATSSYTLFIPTDAAFNKLDADTKKKLLTGDFNWLQFVLKFFVVKGYLTGPQLIALKRGSTLLTAEGSLVQKLDLKTNPSAVILNPVGTAGQGLVTPTTYASAKLALIVHSVDTFLIPASRAK